MEESGLVEGGFRNLAPVVDTVREVKLAWKPFILRVSDAVDIASTVVGVETTR